MGFGSVSRVDRVQARAAATARTERVQLTSMSKTMTLAFALNPCIDAKWHVDQVQWDEKSQVPAERGLAGAKGVNVAWAGAGPSLPVDSRACERQASLPGHHSDSISSKS